MRAKRFLVVFALCFALFICNGYAAWDYVTLMVDVDADLVYNNHVGDDWCNSYCVIYNGNTYSCASGESMEIFYKLDAPLEIYTYICEADDASSDVGSYSQTTSFSESDICDGNSCGWIHTVYVTENGGRYKGNTAQWDVTYTFYVKSSPTPRPTARPTAKPYVLPEKVHPTSTPKPTATPEPTPEPEAKKASTFERVAGVAFLVLYFGSMVIEFGMMPIIEWTERRRKKKRSERGAENGELHALPNSFRLVGYDEDKKTLFVVHIDDNEVFAVYNVSRREYDRLVWSRERYYKRLLGRHKSKSVGYTNQ